MIEVAEKYFFTDEFYEDIWSNMIFWAFDVIIIVMLVPLLLKVFENRKWRTMRKRLEAVTIEHANELIFSLKATIDSGTKWLDDENWDYLILSESSRNRMQGDLTMFEKTKAESHERFDRRALLLLGSLSADMSETFDLVIHDLYEQCEKIHSYYLIYVTKEMLRMNREGTSDFYEGVLRQSEGFDEYANAPDQDLKWVVEAANKIFPADQSELIATDEAYRISFARIRRRCARIDDWYKAELAKKERKQDSSSPS